MKVLLVEDDEKIARAVKRGLEAESFTVDVTDWLCEREVTLVGMEATGVYWKPVHWVLEATIAEVWVINAPPKRPHPRRRTPLTRAPSRRGRAARSAP